MAKRGPKPKSVTPPPVPLAGIGDPPECLDPEARDHWRALAALIDEAGTGSRLDRDLLTLHCAAWSRWREAERELSRPASEGGGRVIVARNGYAQPSPWQVISNDSAKAMRGYLAELGLTPRSRGAVEPATKIEDDPLLAFLAGKPPSGPKAPRTTAPKV